MLKKVLLLCLLTISQFIKIANATGDGTPKETRITIVTTEGIIKIKLYNDTPLHRDNFIKLVNSHFYDSTLFHRVIAQFMIQGGDPESKKAGAGVQLGNGETGYTIPAEIMPAKHFHKKGALAAARMGDDVNPRKESSGCQFYIVQGKTYTDSAMNIVEQRIFNMQKQDAFRRLIERPENMAIKMKFMTYQQKQQTDSLIALSKAIEPMIQSEVLQAGPPFKFNAEQRKVYATEGGAPHLDGGYTVFGEVVEGLDIIDKIAMTQTVLCNPYQNNNLPCDRPITDIRILSMSIDK